MKVLLSAFSCAPGNGSEPGIGWGIVSQVASQHECWVLTHPAVRESIEAELARNPLPKARFVYVEPMLGGLGLNLLSRLHYLLWQAQALRVARRLDGEIGFDLVHHATYGNNWLPSPMGLLGKPFIWSAGCRERTPLSFLSTFSWRGRVYELFRNLALVLLPKLLLTEKLTASRSDLIISSSPRGCWPGDLAVAQFPVGGLPGTEIESLSKVPLRYGGPFRILSMGRLLALKGFGLGIRAFARLQREFPDAEYWIVGTGMEKSYLQRLAASCGVQHAVKFVEWVPREKVPELLSQADVLLHPSFHESFGFVLVEAMAAGRPVVCLDVAAPAALVTSAAGIKVPVQNPQQVEHDLWTALRRLAGNPALRIEMGCRARQYVAENWDWEKVGRRLLRLYETVVTTRPELEVGSPACAETQGSYSEATRA